MLRLDALVNEEGGGVGARAEDSGLHELFDRVSLKLSEIERLRAELRGMIAKTE